MKNQLFLICITLLFVSSCKKDKTYSLGTKNLSVIRNGNAQISIVGGTGTFNYVSSNTLIAEVSTTGMITGKRVGAVTISINGDLNDSCKVSVLPTYNVFKEPLTNWGISISEVKAKESRLLKSEVTGGLLYAGGSSETFVLYLFDSNNNYKLNGCVVSVSPQYTSALASFLIERYVIVSADPVLGYSPLKTFSFGSELQTDLNWWVIYFPYTLKSADLNFSQKYKELLLKMKP